eukprot:6172857-Pleurochrysis_carterae.AAC.4
MQLVPGRSPDIRKLCGQYQVRSLGFVLFFEQAENLVKYTKLVSGWRCGRQSISYLAVQGSVYFPRCPSLTFDQLYPKHGFQYQHHLE